MSEQLKREDREELNRDHKSEQEEWQALVEEGNAAYIRRRLSEAELKFVAALRMAEKGCNKEAFSALTADQQNEANSRLAKSLNNMAALYHSQGKYSMAEDLYNRCLELKLKLHGEEHLEVAVNLHNLAVLNSARQRYKEAEELYERALKMKEKLLGPDHAELAGLITNYALLLKRLERHEEARQMEERLGKGKEAETTGSAK